MCIYAYTHVDIIYKCTDKTRKTQSPGGILKTQFTDWALTPQFPIQ